MNATPVKIMAFGPHPDDIEFGCAPLLIHEARNGNQVKMVVLTRGEASTSGNPEERERESRAAAAVIGAEVEFLEMGGDCHLKVGPEPAMAIAREIRKFQPRIVLAPHPDENQHPDHAVAAKLIRDGARLARYGGLAELRDLPLHSIGNLYFYSITNTLSNPDIVIDVSGIESEWETAILCHKSQMKTKGYLNLVETRARALGATIGVSSAVGLWVNEPVRVRRLSDLTLSSRNY